MLDIRIPRDVWQDAYRNPALGALFDDELRAERTRHEAWERSAARHRGVAFGGMSPGPFLRRSASDMLIAAQQKLKGRDEFEATPEGRFVTALAGAQKAAEAAHRIGEEARAMRSRSFTQNAGRLAALMDQMEQAARDLKSAALDAGLAASDGAEVLQGEAA